MSVPGNKQKKELCGFFATSRRYWPTHQPTHTHGARNSSVCVSGGKWHAVLCGACWARAFLGGGVCGARVLCVVRVCVCVGVRARVCACGC